MEARVPAHAETRWELSCWQGFWRRFEPGPGSGEWEYSIYSEEWNNYDAVYNRTYTFDLPSNAREVTVDIVDGDWVSFYALTLGNVTVPTDERPYGTLQGTFWIGGDGSITGDRNEHLADRGSLSWHAGQWRDFASETSTAVMVGEWGVYNQTGHQVALDYMRDALGAWKDAGMGWALWGLRGDFGVVDSGRSGVAYENFRGRSLDRKMLELLREF
jgi:hypothetical protein